jgi:PEP-CTERM motif
VPSFYFAAPDGTTFTINSIGFTATNSGINVNSASFYDQFGQTDLTNQYLVNTYPPTGDMTLTITLPTAVTAFGLDFSALFADTTASFTLSNGFTTTVVNDFDPDTNILGTQFLGFLSTTPFTTITLSVPEDASWVVEDVTTGTASSVPEPSTWVMLLAGFLGLGLVARRRATMSARAA